MFVRVVNVTLDGSHGELGSLTYPLAPRLLLWSYHFQGNKSHLYLDGVPDTSDTNIIKASQKKLNRSASRESQGHRKGECPMHPLDIRNGANPIMNKCSLRSLTYNWFYSIVSSIAVIEVIRSKYRTSQATRACHVVADQS
jgi:hypothetical protein